MGTLGTIITTSYADRCLRRAERCQLDDRFEPTRPLEVRPHIRLVIDTHARARRLRAALDCRHRAPQRLSRRFWAIRIKPPNGRPRGGRMCTAGSLVIDYATGRTRRARYTFSTTEDPHVRRCRPDGWEFILEDDLVRVYSVLESREPAYYACRFETGRVQWFDSGSDVDPDSVTLEGSTLRWLHAGEPRSASLD